MRRRRRVPKNSIIHYEELKAAACGSGTGGGGRGSGPGRGSVVRLRIPHFPDRGDSTSPAPPKFRMPKLDRRQTYRFGLIIAFGLCMVLLNFFYNYLHPLSRAIILPLMLYFMWTLWKREGSTLFRDRGEGQVSPDTLE